MELDEQFNYLVESGICTQEAIDLVAAINGRSEETINDILYVQTGYRNLEQYTEYEDRETYNEYFAEEDEEEGEE